MLNNIFLKFSEYALLRNGEHPFSNKYGATAEAILTEYTTNDDIVTSSIEDLVAFINSKSRGRIADPEETAKIVQAAARNSYRLDKCLYDPLTISFPRLSNSLIPPPLVSGSPHKSLAGSIFAQHIWPIYVIRFLPESILSGC